MDPELEIFCYRVGEVEYKVVYRLRHPPTAVDRMSEDEPVRINPADFPAADAAVDADEYGLRLGAALFGHEVARAAYRDALGLANGLAAAGPGEPLSLRVRFCTDQRSLALHRLCWEALRVAADAQSPAAAADAAKWFAGGPRVQFSRHLFSGDMRPLRLRPRAALTALVAVADPTDAGRWSPGGRPLARVDVPGQLATARAGLGGMATTVLAAGSEPGAGRVTLDRLLAALRAEPDVLYLVCHGTMVDGEPGLLLEKPDGPGHLTSGLELVRALDTLRTLPRLVVLVSCQSGGDVMAAIGPRLAAAGVAAVLAMQGDLRMSAAAAFLPPFFAELNATGRVDAAVAAGRAALDADPATRADAWIPVLYTRLVEGRLWYTARLATRGGDGAWQGLARDIDAGKCVPILGPGLLEPFLGSTRLLANRLAVSEGYPLSLSGREDLPQVAQFLEAMRAPDAPTVTDSVLKGLAAALRERYSQAQYPQVAAALDGKPIDPGGRLQRALTAAWRAYREGRSFEPHHYLAGMRRLRTFVSVNPDDLMVEALAGAGRAAVRHVSRWDDDFREDESPAAAAGDGGGTGDPADVYHLMGHLSDTDSLVVTEDDYFRFLTANTRRQARKDPARPADLADDVVRGSLASSALLFLGFRITDWDFRVLCRLLLDQHGGGIRRRRTHIAVQVHPEDGTHRDAVRAQEYVERLFHELLGRPVNSQVAVFWGSAEEFLQQLDTQWQQLRPAPPAPAATQAIP